MLNRFIDIVVTTIIQFVLLQAQKKNCRKKVLFVKSIKDLWIIVVIMSFLNSETGSTNEAGDVPKWVLLFKPTYIIHLQYFNVKTFSRSKETWNNFQTGRKKNEIGRNCMARNKLTCTHFSGIESPFSEIMAESRNETHENEPNQFYIESMVILAGVVIVIAVVAFLFCCWCV